MLEIQELVTFEILIKFQIHTHLFRFKLETSNEWKSANFYSRSYKSSGHGSSWKTFLRKENEATLIKLIPGQSQHICEVMCL